MFDRYDEFLKVFNQVHKARNDSRENPHRYNSSKLNKELNDVDSIKDKFEQTLLDEVDTFVKSYSAEYIDILDKYNLLIKSINIQETEKLKLHNICFGSYN
jgi:hypothetical protein